MSRSIHVTRTQIERERAWRWTDSNLRRKRLRGLARAWMAKRRIKEEVRRERKLRAKGPPVPALDPEAVPIRVVDRGPLLHYPATETDLRAILRELPAGTADGVTEIALLLGSEKQREMGRAEQLAELQRDPTGRLAWELFPGVFEGLCLGVYLIRSARIHLYALVRDPARADPVFEPYLKALALATLVHEVAHHFDHRARVARGRWRADEEEKVEGYAEARERQWVQEIVVPYVERTYPGAVDALERWQAEHLGVALPLSLLASEHEEAHFFGSVGSHFSEAVRDLVGGRSPNAVRVQLARELHYLEHYDWAHRILDVVLAAEPLHTEALVLRADLFVHEKRLVEAEPILRDVLAREPDDLEAWRQLVNLEEERRNWRAVVAAASRAIELAPPDSHDHLVFVADRGRGLLELGLYDALEADVAELVASPARTWRVRGRTFRAIALLRQGSFEEALTEANAGLEEARGSWRHQLLAVRFEASASLTPSTPPEPLPAETLAVLRRRGDADWADRLASATSPPAQRTGE